MEVLYVLNCYILLSLLISNLVKTEKNRWSMGLLSASDSMHLKWSDQNWTAFERPVLLCLNMHLQMCLLWQLCMFIDVYIVLAYRAQIYFKSTDILSSFATAENLLYSSRFYLLLVSGYYSTGKCTPWRKLVLIVMTIECIYWMYIKSCGSNCVFDLLQQGRPFFFEKI